MKLLLCRMFYWRISLANAISFFGYIAVFLPVITSLIVIVTNPYPVNINAWDEATYLSWCISMRESSFSLSEAAYWLNSLLVRIFQSIGFSGSQLNLIFDSLAAATSISFFVLFAKRLKLHSSWGVGSALLFVYSCLSFNTSNPLFPLSAINYRPHLIWLAYDNYSFMFRTFNPQLTCILILFQLGFLLHKKTRVLSFLLIVPIIVFGYAFLKVGYLLACVLYLLHRYLTPSSFVLTALICFVASSSVVFLGESRILESGLGEMTGPEVVTHLISRGQLIQNFHNPIFPVMAFVSLVVCLATGFLVSSKKKILNLQKLDSLKLALVASEWNYFALFCSVAGLLVPNFHVLNGLYFEPFSWVKDSSVVLASLSFGLNFIVLGFLASPVKILFLPYWSNFKFIAVPVTSFKEFQAKVVIFLIFSFSLSLIFSSLCFGFLQPYNSHLYYYLNSIADSNNARALYERGSANSPVDRHAFASDYVPGQVETGHWMSLSSAHLARSMQEPAPFSFSYLLRYMCGSKRNDIDLMHLNLYQSIRDSSNISEIEKSLVYERLGNSIYGLLWFQFDSDLKPESTNKRRSILREKLNSKLDGLGG